MKALIVVGMQNDLMAGGAMPVPGAEEIISEVNNLLEDFDTVIFEKDWHPEDHCSFQVCGGSEPVHCVKGMFGAAIHPDVTVSAIMGHTIVHKGMQRDREDHSAFQGGFHNEPGLVDGLKARKIDEIFICGLALDKGVLATALDSVKAGFKTHVLKHACRGVDPDASTRAFHEMENAGVVLAD